MVTTAPWLVAVRTGSDMDDATIRGWARNQCGIDIPITDAIDIITSSYLPEGWEAILMRRPNGIVGIMDEGEV